MRRLVQTAIAAAVLALPLAFPAGAGARTLWVCEVPGEPEPVVFVSAADAAVHGITRANEKAGSVFASKFSESCEVNPPPG